LTVSVGVDGPSLCAGVYAAGKLSSLPKSGATRVVHTRTYPAPPHIMHRHNVLRFFRNLERGGRFV